jgi:hypothetical protein
MLNNYKSRGNNISITQFNIPHKETLIKISAHSVVGEERRYYIPESYIL